MADSTDPFSQNVIGVTDLVQNDINKTPSGVSDSEEGVVSDKYGVLTLDLSDEKLLALRDEWENAYATYEVKIEKIRKRNLESYLGRKDDGQWLVETDTTIAANLQFEAEETFLASALSKNPEPVVYADNTEEGNTVANAVKTMLQFHADQLVVRRKLALMVRQWSINHLGVLKVGWDKKIDDVTVQNRKIQDFIFDPNGYVDAYGDFTSYLGERCTVTAEKLIELYPEHEEYIKNSVENRLGTRVKYTEWRTDEYCFVSYKDKILDKFKNEYFRYEQPVLDATGVPLMSPDGEPMQNEPRNHFAYPKKPYIFLSVFSLQEQPHDITGLIEQNISNQRLINKRTEQIDYNISAANNGYGYSQDNFNEETAVQAAAARKNGNPILIPSGGPSGDAIIPMPAQELGAAVFNELEVNKNNLRTSWGVQGITAEPQDEDQTARGMILNQSHDTTRIGGGIGDAIEQVADNVFNWLTQLYYVFYDDRHFAAVMGNAKAVEHIIFSNNDLNRQLIVSVSPDSLRPKDEVTEMNLAQALFDKGAIGPKTLLKMLSFPNPDEAAADGVLYRIDPMAYMTLNFPEFAAQLQQAQQQQVQLQMMNQAQGAAMNAQAEAGVGPEGLTEPAPGIEQDPASAALSNVPLDGLPQ